MAADFVHLSSRFTSSWPWPESSWGLDPMFGEDGWCRACGVPMRPQVGSLVLQASKLPKNDFRMPNWQFDALCARLPAAASVLQTFQVRTKPVHTPKSQDTDIVQLVPSVAATSWYDPGELAHRAKARHGVSGARCKSCGTWRWMPLVNELLPPARLGPETEDSDLVAGADWFGDGWQAFRGLMFRRPLAEALLALNPRGWHMVEATAKAV